ncbi:MAG TPA: cell division protein ZapA [Gemmatimonadota bacterium]|nr:cell division protein ZapA [Gemmatimonadota bacterium]
MGDSSTGTTRVTILDEPFAIRSEADAEYTRRVAGHVDRSLRELRAKAPSMEPFQAAVLGAMEITDELFRLRERVAELEGDVASRVAGLADAIGEALTQAGRRSSSRKGETAAR